MMIRIHFFFFFLKVLVSQITYVELQLLIKFVFYLQFSKSPSKSGHQDKQRQSWQTKNTHDGYVSKFFFMTSLHYDHNYIIVTVLVTRKKYILATSWH